MNKNNEERNIQFFNNKVRYNAIKKFNNRIIKIPSYVVDEVINKKLKIEIYHKDKYIKTYDYQNIRNFISLFETEKYDGYYNDKKIEYNLAHIEI